MKKLVVVAMIASMFVSGAFAAKKKGKVQTVGVCMPTQSSERWINDGANMKKQLEKRAIRLNFSTQKTKFRHRLTRSKT